jgi:hypothetical protein
MQRAISWMHPSYRDLIIDELVLDDDLRTHFLKNMSVQGIKLTISDTGGKEGRRRLPLITDSRSWKILRSRCVQISASLDARDEENLLTALTAAIQSSHKTEEVRQLTIILQAVCDSVRDKWNSTGAILEASAIRSYCNASVLLNPLPPLPLLEPTWLAIYDEFQDDLDSCKNGGEIDLYILESWTDFLDVIRKNEPRFLRQIGFPRKFNNQIGELLSLINTELSGVTYDSSLDTLRDTSHRFETLRDSVEVFETFDTDWNGDIEMILQDLTTAIGELEQSANELEEPDDDRDDYGAQNYEFDIDSLFSDL